MEFFGISLGGIRVMKSQYVIRSSVLRSMLISPGDFSSTLKLSRYCKSPNHQDLTHYQTEIVHLRMRDWIRPYMLDHLSTRSILSRKPSEIGTAMFHGKSIYYKFPSPPAFITCRWRCHLRRVLLQKQERASMRLQVFRWSFPRHLDLTQNSDVQIQLVPK